MIKKGDAKYIFVMSYHWIQHHVMSLGLISGTTAMFNHDNQNEVQPWHCCWYYMMPVIPKITPLHSLCQDN